MDTFLKEWHLLKKSLREILQKMFQKSELYPSWCGSVDWALACEPKGHGFGSKCIPALRAGSQLGVHKKQPHIDVSFHLFPSLPPSLKNK